MPSVPQAGRADRIVKGAPGGQPWNVLMDLTLSLAGGDRPA